ncbi:hypothetical protein D7X98_11855 [bacterium 1XD8-76]|nr:hypothetical protein D7X98_11855 [bacterium 1XD8-76]
MQNMGHLIKNFQEKACVEVPCLVNLVCNF